MALTFNFPAQIVDVGNSEEETSCHLSVEEFKMVRSFVAFLAFGILSSNLPSALGNAHYPSQICT